MGKNVTHVSQFYRPQWMIIAGVIALLSYGMPMILDLIPKQTPSAKKPFDDIPSFWPHYQSEHQNDTAVKLHATGTTFAILVMLAHPELLGAGIVALKCGQVAFYAFRHLDHGLPEAIVVLGMFFLVNKFLGGQTKMALVALTIGYSFAWTGHFFFENNKPATFIYPTFSLACDFMLWAQELAGLSITF